MKMLKLLHNKQTTTIFSNIFMKNRNEEPPFSKFVTIFKNDY